MKCHMPSCDGDLLFEQWEGSRVWKSIEDDGEVNDVPEDSKIIESEDVGVHCAGCGREYHVERIETDDGIERIRVWLE